jgi:HSP20 family protein
MKLWNPQMDVRETDKDIIVCADVPGVKKEDLHVELNDNILTISGERKEVPRSSNLADIITGEEGEK